MTIAWDDVYKIGDAQIDHQHEQLFGHINKLLAASDKPALTAGAMALFKYTREHFTHEEQLMKKIRYPAISAHIQQHNDLISKLSIVALSISHETLKKSELEDFLKGWLFNHIRSSDTKLANYVKLSN